MYNCTVNTQNQKKGRQSIKILTANINLSYDIFFIAKQSLSMILPCWTKPSLEWATGGWVFQIWVRIFSRIIVASWCGGFGGLLALGQSWASLLFKALKR